MDLYDRAQYRFATHDRWRSCSYFGSADGWVYCLSSSDGELAWRFRAYAQRSAACGVRTTRVGEARARECVGRKDGTVYCVAGRSNFLTAASTSCGWMPRPVGSYPRRSSTRGTPTGENLQARLQILNMPAGLPDILSSDGKFIYMRSQQFDREGLVRHGDWTPFGPSQRAGGLSNAARRPTLLLPMGFLDGSWFHRSYWSWASLRGGPNGYYLGRASSRPADASWL